MKYEIPLEKPLEIKEKMMHLPQKENKGTCVQCSKNKIKNNSGRTPTSSYICLICKVHLSIEFFVPYHKEKFKLII